MPFLTYSHNLSLDVWLEYGLLGFAAWWALAAAIAVAAVAGERAALGWRFRGLWLGLLAIHAHGLTDARQSVDVWTWLPFFAIAGAFAAHVSRHRLRVSPGWACAPLGIAAIVAGAAVVGRGSPVSAWEANLGAVAQARADLGRVDDSTRAALQATARAHFEHALDADASDVPALRRLGIAELDADHHAEAARLLRRAWLIEPSNLATRKAYGLAAMWTGELDTAVTLLTDAPGMTNELNAWSHWRESRGEIGLAIAAARVSLGLDPSQEAVTATLATLERRAHADVSERGH